MRDRQLFEEYELSNGIRLFHYGGEFPISSFRLQFPVGSGHATEDNGFLPGEPHFLEHMLMSRSQEWPGSNEFSKLLGMKAGDDNGATYPLHTVYNVDVPARYADLGMRGLVDRTFRPIFNQDDLDRERGVISNERKKMEKFFPGLSHSSKYYNTEVIRDILLTPQQRLGSDLDLAKVSLETLESAHQKIVRTVGTVAISVGQHDVEMVKQHLEAVPRTENQSYVPHIHKAEWVKPEFHVAKFDNVSEPSIELCWLRGCPTHDEWNAICFVMRLMVNSVHGIMYEELRHEKGWAYHMDWSTSLYPDQCRYGFYFPLNSLEEIEYVRSVIFDRIEAALGDQLLIEREFERRIASKAHAYQTSTSIAGGGADDLRTYGRIHTEGAWEESLKKILDPAFRGAVKEKYFTRESFGETAFFPA